MKKIKFEYRITAAYLIIGGIWIIFSDKITETDHEDVLIISFINSGLNSETNQNTKFSQIGETTMNSEKSIAFNQNFRNSILVS